MMAAGFVLILSSEGAGHWHPWVVLLSLIGALPNASRQLARWRRHGTAVREQRDGPTV
jgi:hypothetical protein